MAVKPIDKMPQPQTNERMEMLKHDIEEIVNKHIRFSEITNPPYPQSTMRERLSKAIRIVTWETGKSIGAFTSGNTRKAFRIESRKIDGEVRWYVEFDAVYWEEEWDRIRREKR